MHIGDWQLQVQRRDILALTHPEENNVHEVYLRQYTANLGRMARTLLTNTALLRVIATCVNRDMQCAQTSVGDVRFFYVGSHQAAERDHATSSSPGWCTRSV